MASYHTVGESTQAMFTPCVEAIHWANTGGVVYMHGPATVIGESGLLLVTCVLQFTLIIIITVISLIRKYN